MACEQRAVKGKRIQLKELLLDPSQAWQTLTVKWYGDAERLTFLLNIFFYAH